MRSIAAKNPEFVQATRAIGASDSHTIMTRPPITPERMLGEASKTRVIYRSHSVHPRHQANFRAFDPLDFLAEVSVYIPDAHEMITLFSGWYFHRTRGYRRRHGLLGKAERTEPVFDEPTRVPLEVRRTCLRRAEARRAPDLSRLRVMLDNSNSLRGKIRG